MLRPPGGGGHSNAPRSQVGLAWGWQTKEGGCMGSGVLTWSLSNLAKKSERFLVQAACSQEEEP